MRRTPPSVTSPTRRPRTTRSRHRAPDLTLPGRGALVRGRCEPRPGQPWAAPASVQIRGPSSRRRLLRRPFVLVRVLVSAVQCRSRNLLAPVREAGEPGRRKLLGHGRPPSEDRVSRAFPSTRARGHQQRYERDRQTERSCNCPWAGDSCQRQKRHAPTGIPAPPHAGTTTLICICPERVRGCSTPRAPASPEVLPTLEVVMEYRYVRVKVFGASHADLPTETTLSEASAAPTRSSRCTSTRTPRA